MFCGLGVWVSRGRLPVDVGGVCTMSHHSQPSFVPSAHGQNYRRVAENETEKRRQETGGRNETMLERLLLLLRSCL